MPLARTLAVALVGVEGRLVEVEADLAQGLPGLTLIGLPDTSLQEARDRIRAAIVNSGESWPQRRITLGLSPASLPKRGSSFDLAMAIARSKLLPRLGRLAGDSPRVIRRCGHDSPLLTMAARIRSRASCNEVSGRPIRVSPGRPWARSASTSTSRPSTPTRATARVRASGIRTPRVDALPGSPAGSGTARSGRQSGARRRR